MLVCAVVVSGVDVLVGAVVQVADKRREQRSGRVARPVAIPDVVHVDGAQQHWAPVIVDAVAAAAAELALSVGVLIGILGLRLGRRFLLRRSIGVFDSLVFSIGPEAVAVSMTHFLRRRAEASQEEECRSEYKQTGSP